MSENTWERADADDLDRCQGVTNNGQCINKAISDSQFCMAHGGRNAIDKKKNEDLRNYRLTKFKSRVSELSNSDAVLSLKEEIGILRMMVEERLESCADTAELLLVAGPLSDLMMKVEKVVVSCNRLEMRLGNLLDKGRVLQFAQTVVQIIGDEITDEKILEKISNKILGAIENDKTAN